jgi:hypothetical protein
MWVAYYLRRWPRLLAASARLLRLGFGTNLPRIVQGAWLMLRAVQLWAPFPDNDPDGAQARMHELYALIRLSFGEPADPAQAASLEIDWWRAHRKRQYALHPAETGDELVESVTRLYSYLFGKAEAMVRPAAVHRVEAMDLSDQWVREGCPPDSPLLPLEHAALVRAYSALLAAVHHEDPGKRPSASAASDSSRCSTRPDREGLRGGDSRSIRPATACPVPSPISEPTTMSPG